MHNGANVKNGELWALGAHTRSKIATKEVKTEAAQARTWGRVGPAQTFSDACALVWEPLQSVVNDDLAACSHTSYVPT